MTLKDIKLVHSARVVHILFVLSLVHCESFSFLWFRVKQATEIMKLAFLGAFAKLLKATVNFVMSVCPSARISSAPTGRIFMKIVICVFFQYTGWRGAD